MEDKEVRVERRFHTAIWDAANDFSRVERAVAEARDVMYKIRERISEDSDDEVLRYMAGRWLETFGSDPLREPGGLLEPKT